MGLGRRQRDDNLQVHDVAPLYRPEATRRFQRGQAPGDRAGRHGAEPTGHGKPGACDRNPTITSFG